MGALSVGAGPCLHGGHGGLTAAPAGRDAWTPVGYRCGRVKQFILVLSLICFFNIYLSYLSDFGGGTSLPTISLPDSDAWPPPRPGPPLFGLFSLLSLWVAPLAPRAELSDVCRSF